MEEKISEAIKAAIKRLLAKICQSVDISFTIKDVDLKTRPTV